MPTSPLRYGLPGYAWDSRLGGTGRYRVLKSDGSLGKMVSAQTLTGIERNLANASASQFSDLAGKAVNGSITPADFQRAIQGELKNLYNASSALARGGFSKMDAAAYGRNGQILRGEYQHLAQFAQDIADGKLTEAQARARAALYAGKAYSRYWAEDARARLESGQWAEEQWHDTGLPGECDRCAELAAMGRVPIGTLGTVPGAGDTPCLGACRCSIEYFEGRSEPARAESVY